MSRVFDIAMAAFALVLSAPLIAAIAVAVRLSSAGPALFAQPRLGLRGLPFRILKFRTMFHSAPDVRNADGSAHVGEDDPRVTSLGRWLRSASLDELPQLWNVLRGDMSIVGPRPDQLDQLRYYNESDRLKLDVRPGLTGLAQISGRNSISWQRRRELDVEYVRRRTVALDLEIIFRTIPYVLLRRDIEQKASLHGNITR